MERDFTRHAQLTGPQHACICCLGSPKRCRASWHYCQYHRWWNPRLLGWAAGPANSVVSTPAAPRDASASNPVHLLASPSTPGIATSSTLGDSSSQLSNGGGTLWLTLMQPARARELAPAQAQEVLLSGLLNVPGRKCGLTKPMCRGRPCT